MTGEVPTVEVGRTYASPGYRLIAAAAWAVLGAAVVLVGAVLVAGGDRLRFVWAVTALSGAAAIPVARALTSGLRLDLDGRYATLRSLRGRSRVPRREIRAVAWPPDDTRWVAPDLVLDSGRRVPVRALTRIELGVWSNTAEVHTQVAALEAELHELARRWDRPS